MNNCDIINICGLPASGKSTVMCLLPAMISDEKQFKYVPEPVHDFCDCYGYDPILLFYVNPQRYACIAQNHICDVLRKHYNTLKPGVQYISERGLFCPIVFSHCQWDQGFLNPLEHDYIVYKSLETIKTLTPGYPYGCRKLILLDIDPDIAIDRINKRNTREIHMKGLYTYLQCLREHYLTFYTQYTSANGADSALMLDTAQHSPFELAQKIAEFISK